MKRSLATSSVQITGSRESLEEPKLECTVHTMQLTTQDLHSLQLDSSTIPEPKFTNSFPFSLPLGYSVVYALFAVQFLSITDAELHH
jgi:hypothetical protein